MQLPSSRAAHTPQKCAPVAAQGAHHRPAVCSAVSERRVPVGLDAAVGAVMRSGDRRRRHESRGRGPAEGKGPAVEHLRTAQRFMCAA